MMMDGHPLGDIAAALITGVKYGSERHLRDARFAVDIVGIKNMEEVVRWGDDAVRAEFNSIVTWQKPRG